MKPIVYRAVVQYSQEISGVPLDSRQPGEEQRVGQPKLQEIAVNEWALTLIIDAPVSNLVYQIRWDPVIRDAQLNLEVDNSSV